MTPTAEPQFDPEISQYVASTVVGDVFGDTWSDCFRRAAEAARVASAHAAHNPDEEAKPWECNCVLPVQSCPACRKAARAVHGSGDDPLPF